MADFRRQTRSTRRRGSQTDAQFWSKQPDPLLIERGQADAIRLLRSAVNTASGTTTANKPTGANTTNVSGIPQMVFVDDEGLEEQFLTDSEDTANVLDTSANHVTTPVNTTPANRSIQQTQHEELDLQLKGYFVGVCVVYARLLRRVCLSMYWESFTHLRLMRGWNR